MGLEKINDMRKYVGMSIDDLSEKSGVPKGTLSKITAGITKNPSVDTVKSIVHAMGFTLDDLDIFPLSKNNSNFSISEIEHIKKYRNLDNHGKEIVDFILEKEYTRSTAPKETATIYNMPFSYDLAASAGTGEYAMDIAHFKTVGLTEKPPRGADFLIRISGNSMEPKFYDDDKVFIKRMDSVDVGEIGLFYVDGDVYIKKQGVGELISLNPSYKPIPIYEFSSAKCFGKVLGRCECEIVEI